MERKRKEKINTKLFERDVKTYFTSIRVILILVFIIITFMLVSAIVKGDSDIDYNFTTNTIINDDSDGMTAYNEGYIYPRTDTYEGAYSFTEDTDGIIPTDWTDGSTGTCSAYTTSDYGDHDKVLRLEDDSASYHASAYTTFTGVENGRIEFWHLVHGGDVHGNPLLGFDGATVGINVLCTAGKYNLYYGASVHASNITILFDTWYHIMVEFDCSDNRVNLYINGILEVEGAFQNVVAEIDKIDIETDNTKTNYDYYVDAIDFSWDGGYSLYQNLVPTYNTTTFKSPLGFDFVFNEDGTLTENGQTTIPYFNYTSTLGGLYITDLSGDVDERSLVFEPLDTNHQTISRDFYNDSGIIQIYLECYFSDTNTATQEQHWEFNIYSRDDTLVGQFLIEGTNSFDFYYYDGSDYVEIDNAIESNDFSLNIYLSNNIMYYYYWNDKGTTQGKFIPLLTLNKAGLGEFEIDSYADGSTAHSALSLNRVQFYVEGYPQTDDFTEYIFNDGYDWNLSNPIILEYDADCNITINYNLDDPQQILANTLVEGYQRDYGVYGSGSFTGKDFIIGTKGVFNYSEVGYFRFHSIYIYEIQITDGTNTYSGLVESSNLDNNESYFYYSSSRLYFTYTSNDTNLEYMTMTFTLTSTISTVNRSIYYGGIKSYGNLYAEFDINYDDSTTTGSELGLSFKNYNQILPQGKYIESFSFLITDDDNDVDYTLTGYFNSFTLKYYPNIQLTITTSNLIGAMIPLMILTAPTLLVYFSTKKWFKTMSIIPMLGLMGVVCYMGSLIPIWILFTILVGCGVLIFAKWENLFLVFITFFTIGASLFVYGGIFPTWIFIASAFIMIALLIFGIKNNISGGDGT